MLCDINFVMEENEKISREQEKKAPQRKKIIAAGASCFPLALTFAVYTMFLVVYFFRFSTSPDVDYGPYFIVFLLVEGMRSMFRFASAFYAILLGALTVFLVICGISMIKNIDEKKARSSLGLSFGLSVTVLVLAFYPLVIGFCRLTVHGFDEGNAVMFFLRGLIPTAAAVLCIVFNRIAVKELKKILLATEQKNILK